MKIAVVGLGGSGSAALRFLARWGHQVTGYEQFKIGHVHGSSHGESRIIRYVYPDVFYTKLMADSYKLWFELEDEAQEKLFIKCGGIFFGDKNDRELEETERVLVSANIPYEKLTAEQTMEKHPAFNLGSNEIAIYQGDSGFLRATKCVQANIRLAQNYGALIHENCKVENIYDKENKVIVCSSNGEEQFDRVIVTAGPWMSSLLKELNLPLKTTRQQIVYFKINEKEEYFQSNGIFPIWIDLTENLYGFPSDGQIDGIKLAFHHHGPVIDDLDKDRPAVDENYKEQIRGYTKRRFPKLSSEITYGQTCVYTNTPNSDFIVDRLPNKSNIFMVSGCSGHGFKFTVLLGHIIALLATDQQYSHDLSRFQLSSFI